VALERASLRKIPCRTVNPAVSLEMEKLCRTMPGPWQRFRKLWSNDARRGPETRGGLPNFDVTGELR
jgi:hypothetical protein